MFSPLDYFLFFTCVHRLLDQHNICNPRVTGLNLNLGKISPHTLSLMVICLSRMIQKSCQISTQLLKEKFVIAGQLSRKAGQVDLPQIYDQIGIEIIVKPQTNSHVITYLTLIMFLAHLSETQGELIVYYFVRRPSVRPQLLKRLLL